MKGKHHTEEARLKMSHALKGRVSTFKGRHHTEEVKEKLRQHTRRQRESCKGVFNSIDRTGTHVSPENKEKLRLIHLGSHLSEERKEAIRERTKGERNPFYGKHHSEENKAKMVAPHLGKHLSEEHRAKISKANKGRPISEEQKLRLRNANLGKHVTEETKAKLREITKRQWVTTDLRTRRTGENSPQWLGGKSFEPYTRSFNKQIKYLIRVRDGFTCQVCGITENENCRKLSTHHIDYDKNNSMPNNLVSLCVKCHTKTNKNREYWMGYFRDLLNNRQSSPKSMEKKRKISHSYQKETQQLTLDLSLTGVTL